MYRQVSGLQPLKPCILSYFDNYPKSIPITSVIVDVKGHEIDRQTEGGSVSYVWIGSRLHEFDPE